MSSSAFTPSTTTVTNNVPVNVPVVTAWESYTPAIAWPTSNQGTLDNTNTRVQTRRVGNSLEIRGVIAFSANGTSITGMEFTLPSGLTPDNSVVATNLLRRNYETGSAGVYRSGALSSFELWPRFDASSQSSSGQNVISFVLSTGGTPENYSILSPANLTTTGDRIRFRALIPIAEWSGSGTTTLATRAVEEYLSTTSFSSLNVNRGPNGAALPTTTPAGTFESISFGPNPWQTTWLATDIVSIEVDPFGNGKWTSISGSIDLVSLTILEGSLTYVGLGFYFDGTNWVLIRGKYRNPNTANGVWSAIGAGARYRIKKVSSGAQVGYPVSARNIVGDTSGSVVPVGMLGEKIDLTPRAVTTASAAWRANTTALITLNPGIYLVFGNAGLPSGSGQASVAAISTNSNNDSTGFINSSYSASNYQTSAAGGSAPLFAGYIAVQSGTTQQLFAKAYGDLGTPIVTITGFIVRIA